MNPTSRWRTILATITIAYALVIVVWLSVIYTGVYDMPRTARIGA